MSLQLRLTYPYCWRRSGINFCSSKIIRGKLEVLLVSWSMGESRPKLPSKDSWVCASTHQKTTRSILGSFFPLSTSPFSKSWPQVSCLFQAVDPLPKHCLLCFQYRIIGKNILDTKPKRMYIWVLPWMFFWTTLHMFNTVKTWQYWQWKN